MTEPITPTDLDNLADIIWWIKGYAAGAGDNFESCPFQPLHVESLRKAWLALKGDPAAALSPNEADAPCMVTGDGLEKPSAIHERLFNERYAKLQEDAEVHIPFIDWLVAQLERTIETNGRVIIMRLLEFSKRDDGDPRVGWEARNFARAAIAMLEAGE